MTRKIYYILIAMTATVMAACSDGSSIVPSEPDDHTSSGIILFGSSKSGDGDIAWVNGRVRSRDGGENEIASVEPEDFGVFAFGDGPNTTYIFRNQRVFRLGSSEYIKNLGPDFVWRHGNDVWPYTTEVDGNVQRPWEEMRYRFFAYSPWAENEDVSVSAETYSGFTTFTWDNIPGFTSFDYVLANEIVDLDNTDGDFTSRGNIVSFEMRHILSRLRFFFKMSDAYRKIRRIEIDSLTVVTAGKVKSATFNFKNNAWDETVHWGGEKIGDAKPVTLYSDHAEHYFVATTYGTDPFSSVYVYPQDNFNNLKMTINYTVYDSEGVVTRNAELTNNVALPDWKLDSGYYYDIFISIAPEYIYVLSDNDQDFDGYVIIKE